MSVSGTLRDGVISGAGAYLGAKYVGPALEKTVEVTAKKTQEVVHDNTNTIASTAICTTAGAAVADLPEP